MSDSFARSIRSIQADRARPMLLWITLAMLILAAWVSWFLLSRVAVYEVSVHARVEAVEMAHTIEAPLGGRIQAAHLSLGSSIEVGDVLAEIDHGHLILDLADAQARFKAMEEQRDALEEEILAQQHALEEHRRTTPLRLEEARARHREALAMEQYTAMNAEQLAILAARGDASELERRRAEAEHEQAREAAVALRLTIDRLEAEDELAVADRLVRIRELRRERERLNGERGSERAAIEKLAFEISQRRITAPIAGIIAQAEPLQRGRVIAEGQWIATIIPRPERHRVVADFEAVTALGRIKPGQPARVRLTGFPWSQYGTIDAVVERVAGEARDGLVRAVLRIDAEDQPLMARLQHDLPGTVEVEVDRVAPAVMVLRAAGTRVTEKRAETPANARPEGKGGRF